MNPAPSVADASAQEASETWQQSPALSRRGFKGRPPREAAQHTKERVFDGAIAVSVLEAGLCPDLVVEAKLDLKGLSN